MSRIDIWIHDSLESVKIDLVSMYINKLQHAENDNNRFDQVVRELKGDRSVREIEVHAIASGYIGFSVSKKSKGSMIKSIENHQALNARQLARMASQY